MRVVTRVRGKLESLVASGARRPADRRLAQQPWRKHWTAGDLLAALAMVAGTAGAQTPGGGALHVELSVEPEEVTVGDPFYAAVRVTSPSGFRVEYSDYPGGDSLQAIEPVRLIATAAGDTAAVYTLVAWVAGSPLTAAVSVNVFDGAGAARTHIVSLRLPVVASVLPEGDEAIAPRPPKGLLVPPLLAGFPWWLLALLLALLAALLAYWLWRRRAGEVSELIDPREWALAQLDDPVAGALLRSGELVELVGHISRVVRTYIYRVQPELGLDLTTTELVENMAGGDIDADVIDAVAGILFAADRVKFARYQPTAVEAENMLRAARHWVGTYPPVEEAESEQRKAA